MNHLLRLWILECLIVAISLSSALVLDFMLVLFPVLSCTMLVLVTCGYLAQVLLTSLLASKQNQFKFRIFIVKRNKNIVRHISFIVTIFIFSF